MPDVEGVELRGELRSSLPVRGDLPSEGGLPVEDDEDGGAGDSVPPKVVWKEPNSPKEKGEALPDLVGVTQRGFWLGCTPEKG